MTIEEVTQAEIEVHRKSIWRALMGNKLQKFGSKEFRVPLVKLEPARVEQPISMKSEPDVSL